MVFKIIFFTLTLISSAQCAETIELNVQKQISSACSKVFTVFLKELKELSNEQIFTLTTTNKNNTVLTLQCNQSDEKIDSITIIKGDERLKLNFLGTIDSFDALDMFEFQKKFLRNKPEINLKPEGQTTNNYETKINRLQQSETNTKSTFLPYLGAFTGGVSGAVLSPNSESRILNVLVFSTVGAITGYFIDQLINKESK